PPHLQTRLRLSPRRARWDLGLALFRARLEDRVARVVSAAAGADREPLRLPAGTPILSVARRFHVRPSSDGRPRHRLHRGPAADASRPRRNTDRKGPARVAP